MINNLTLIFYWWFLLFTLGMIFLPWSTIIFRRFWSQGYAFSKVLAILGLSYLAWIIATLRLAPFSMPTLWGIIILFSLFNYLVLKTRKQQFKKALFKNFKTIIFQEIVFLGGLLAWALVRSYQPDIQGLEKYMDFGFVNTILRSSYFPPTDMWFAGKAINYYYFGHLISAVLTKLSGLDSDIGYNLMIATIFSLTLSTAFCFGANLVFSVRPKKFFRQTGWKLIVAGGLLTALVLTLGGNLHSLYWFIKNGNFDHYWYPDATRFIVEKFGAADNTIHEFPIYSFIVADLHGHMINIPNVILTISLIFVIGLKTAGKNNWRQLAPQLATLAFCLAIALMTNAWDYPIYLLTAMSAFFLLKLKSNSFHLVKTVLELLPVGLWLVVASMALASPFLWQFKNIAEGLGSVDFHSPIWTLLVLWGLPLFLSLAFLAVIVVRRRFNRMRPTDLFVLVLLANAWLLIVVPEIIYVKDIYTHSHQRANTMFKLTYQSFIIFSLASGYIITRVLGDLKRKSLKLLFFSLSLLLLTFIFIYPQKAIVSYYGLKGNQSFFGLGYLKSRYPDDYQAIDWLRNHIEGQPVIVEAVGESYTDYARVSANTGLPTIVGWRVHEWLWRGSFDEANLRAEEVRQIYESPNLITTKSIINKYQVDYLFIGDLERQQYPRLNLTKFDLITEIVFSSGKTKVLKIINN